MKKVKVTLKPESSGKKIYLFSSSESLYVWMCALEKGEHLEIIDVEELLLEPGSFIEAELLGFEYTYEDNRKFRRLDLVRLGLASYPQNASGMVVTLHTGWVSGGLLPMKDYDDADIEARVITEPGISKINLEALAEAEKKAELPSDEP